MTESSTSPIEMFKNFYSTIFLIFSVAVLMGLIFQGKTRLSDEFNPWLAFGVLWVAVIWLTMIEGGQASKVGLIPVDLDLYKESHPLAHQSMELVGKGDNLDRYLMGRQFMVVLIVFCINISGGPIGGPNSLDIWGLPYWLKWLMFTFPFGIMTLFTCMIGQLNSQVNAAHCMLDYINNYFALFTLYVAMFIEWTGLLHASYLIAMLVASISGKPIKSNEPPKEGMTLIFFWLRGLYSTAILLFSLAVVIKSLFMGRTTMDERVPEVVSVILFFVLMSVVGMLEGMQIAFFAVTKIPIAERGAAKFAKMTCELLFRGEGRNLPGFMIGRQICVVSCMIIVAKVTTVTAAEGGPNVLGVSDDLQKFLEFGFQGALVTTILGSISWQLVASAFPIEFLTIPATYVLLRICLLLEATGLCSGAWVLAAIHKSVANFQHDEVYIGTAEEREGKSMGDRDDMNKGIGNIAKLPGFIEGAPLLLQTLVKEDPAVLHYLESIRQMKEEEVYNGDIAEQGQNRDIAEQGQHVEQPKVDNHIVTIVDARGDEKYKLNSTHRTSVSELLDTIGDGMLKTDDGFLIPSKSFILQSGTYEWTPKNDRTKDVATSEEHAANAMEELDAEAPKEKDEEDLIQISDL